MEVKRQFKAHLFTNQAMASTQRGARSLGFELKSFTISLKACIGDLQNTTRE